MGDSLFVVGARVAVSDFASFREARIAKVHKNGNFTLEGSLQQWRPQSADRAWKTGDRWRWNGGTLEIWTAKTDEKIRQAAEEKARRERWRKLRADLNNLRESQVTELLLDAIEAALEFAHPPHDAAGAAADNCRPQESAAAGSPDVLRG